MTRLLVDVDLLVKGCHGLPKMDFVGHADPYFILTVTTPGGDAEPAFKYRSHVHYNTGRPVWNEDFSFTRVPVGTKVHIQVMDKDHLSAHDPVGDCELVLDEDFLDRAMVATAKSESVAASEPSSPPAATPPTASPQRSRHTSSSGGGIARRSTGAISSDTGDGGGGSGSTPGRLSTSGFGDPASGMERLSLSGVSTGAASIGAASSAGSGGPDGLSAQPPVFFGLELQVPIRADAKVRKSSAGTLSLGVGCRPCSGPASGAGTSGAPGPGGLLHRGPVRYRTASSWVAGKLTGHMNADSGWRAYAAYKLRLAGLNEFFPDGAKQPWNRAYDKAQQVFNSKALRAAVHTQHNMLYADNGKQKRRGVLRGGGDLVTLLRGGVRHGARRYYTYCINADGAMCFSETGAKFFSDFMSKHAMHADMAECVVYAGEFTLVPPGLMPPELLQRQQQQQGLQAAEADAADAGAGAGTGAVVAEAPATSTPAPAGRISAAEAAADAALATAAAASCSGERAEGWTLVIDNNSGTYAPASSQLAALGGLMQFNFPGLAVAVVDSLEHKAALAALHRRVPSRCPPPAPAGKK